MKKIVKINFIIIITLIVYTIFCATISYGAGAMDSAPGVELGNGTGTQSAVNNLKDTVSNVSNNVNNKVNNTINKENNVTIKTPVSSYLTGDNGNGGGSTPYGAGQQELQQSNRENFTESTESDADFLNRVKKAYEQGNINSLTKVEKERLQNYEPKDAVERQMVKDILGNTSLNDIKTWETDNNTSNSNYKVGVTEVDGAESSADHTLGEIMDNADNFLNKGTSEIDEERLKTMKDTVYNILLVLAIIVAVFVGAILGIQFIMGGATAKAKVQEALPPYLIGCAVAFGAFTIWKIVVVILQSST